MLVRGDEDALHRYVLLILASRTSSPLEALLHIRHCVYDVRAINALVTFYTMQHTMLLSSELNCQTLYKTSLRESANMQIQFHLLGRDFDQVSKTLKWIIE